MMHVPEAAGLLRQFTDQSDSEVLRQRLELLIGGEVASAR